MKTEIITVEKFLQELKYYKNEISNALNERKTILPCLHYITKEYEFPLPREKLYTPKNLITFSNEKFLYFYNPLFNYAVFLNEVYPSDIKRYTFENYRVAAEGTSVIIDNHEIFIIHEKGFIDLKNEINYELDIDLDILIHSYYIRNSISVLLLTREYSKFALIYTIIHADGYIWK